MKKLIIYCLVVVMILGIGSFCISANDGVLFDLNLDNCAIPSINGVADIAGNAIIETVGTIVSVQKMGTLKGEQKYIDCSTGMLKANSSLIKNQNELSVEAWAKPKITQGAYNSLFGITKPQSGIKGTMESYFWQPNATQKFMTYRAAHRTSASTNIEFSYSNASEFNERWTHFVFTRKWNQLSATWDFTVYANGILIGSGSKKSGLKTDENDMFLYIGGAYEGLTERFLNGAVGSFKVYSRVLGETEIQADYNNQKRSFIELPNSMKPISVSPASKNLSFNGGKIDIEFDNYPNTQTLQDSIVFTKNDGTQIKGGTSVSIDSDNEKLVSVAFGKLEPNTQYRLEIKSALTSINGINAPQTEYFFQTGADTSMILNEDFQSDDYVVGQKPPSNKGVNYGEADYIKVYEENGDKFVRLQGFANTMIYKIFDTPLTETSITGGAVIVEIVLRASSADTARGAGKIVRETGRIFFDQNNMSVTQDIAKITDGFPVVINAYSGTVPFYYGKDMDANGFYGVRYLIRNSETGGGLELELSNLFNLTAGNCVIKIDKSKGSEIDGIMAAHIYPWGSDIEAQLAYDRVEVSAFKIYSITEPKILYTTANHINPENRNLDIVFNDDMNAETIKANNMIIREKNTSRVIPFHITAAYNENNRRIGITLDEYLSFETEYTITCNGIKNMQGIAINSAKSISFTSASYSVTATEASFIKSADNITAKTVVTNAAAEDKNIIFIAVLYDEEGRTKKIKSKADIVKAGKDTDFSVTLEGTDIIKGYKVRAYVWERTNAGIQTVTMNPAEINY